MAQDTAWCQKEKVKRKTGLLRVFLTVSFRVWEFISNTIFWFIFHNAEKKALPAIDNLLLMESASSLANKIRTQKVRNQTKNCVKQIYNFFFLDFK